MRELVIVAFLLLAATSPASGSSVSLTAHDDGFATDLVAFARASGHQALSDLSVSGDLAYIAWYDHGPYPPRNGRRPDPWTDPSVDAIGHPRIFPPPRCQAR